MFIEELTIRGYGRLKSFRIEPGPGLNVIHGPNESGKTSVGNCLRDLLLGPGQWDEDVQGPRAPDAHPWDGERFQARVRYRVDDVTFLVQRDFDSGDVRARNPDSGSDLPVDPSGPAPGVRPPETLFADDPAPEVAPEPAVPVDDLGTLRDQAEVLGRRLEGVREEARKALEEASRAAYVFRKSQGLAVGERLDQVRDFERTLSQLRGRLQAVQRFANVRADQREIVLRNQARLDVLDQEMAENRRSLETLQETRKSVGQRLSQYEKFFLVKPEDVTSLQSLDLGDRMSPAAIEEKQRNVEGFKQKEADVSARLQEVAPRFSQFPSDEEFELRVGSLEKDVGRTEIMAGRETEARENERRLSQLHTTSTRYLLWSVILLAMAGVLGWLASQLFGGLWWASALAAVLAVAVFVMKVRDDRGASDLRFANERITDEVERMRATIDRGREGLRAIFETCGVTTIKDLRAAYREYRALQRDLATVRAYIWNLERDLEAGRAQEQVRLETPRILVETGIISEWEPVTPHAVTTFLDRWKQFQAAVAEEEGLKRRIHELMRDLDARREEEEKLKVRQSALLREMGVAAATELDWAIMGRQEYDRLSAQVTQLEEKVRGLLDGVSLSEAQAQYADAMATVKRYEEQFPDRRVSADPGRVAEYEQAYRQAQAAYARAQAESGEVEGALTALLERVRGLEGEGVPVGVGAAGRGVAAVSAVTESPVEVLTRRLQTVYQEITLQDIVLQVVEDRGRPMLQVQRPGGGGWISPASLGRGASELLQALMRVEMARGPRGGNLPLILENPFARLDRQRQQRAASWLISASAERQIFLLVAEADTRDLVRSLLTERGVPFTEMVESELEILAAQVPAA